ncbi:hypothetical protein ACXWR7_13650, partial [Streptococcus pyogenes]
PPLSPPSPLSPSPLLFLPFSLSFPPLPSFLSSFPLSSLLFSPPSLPFLPSLPPSSLPSPPPSLSSFPPFPPPSPFFP